LRSGTVALLLGILLLYAQPRLPDPFLVEFLPFLLLLAAGSRRYRWPALLACGFLWALWRAEIVLTQTLPEDLEGQSLQVAGTVVSIPAQDAASSRFLFQVEEIREPAGSCKFQGRVRLSWYQQAPSLHPGERWLLPVRLKRAHGFVNPGGFDYEGWLFAQGIVVTGYVQAGKDPVRLDPGGGHTIDRLRQRLAEAIDDSLADNPYAGMVKALSLGLQEGIPDAQWQIFRTTGTGHLIAISGLHISLVAGLAFFAVRRLWSLAGGLALLLPAPVAGACAALLAAAGYAALAGFSIPTQRALIMVGVVMGGLLLRRRMSPSLSLAVALGLVLVVDPGAVLAAGFWLSFLAVAAILFGMQGRLAGQGLWWQWGRVQWIVGLGLLPPTLALFQQYPWLAPLANLLAVPWMSFLVVPLVLLGAALLLPLPAVGGSLLGLAAAVIEPLWWILEYCARLNLTALPGAAPPWWAILAGGLGAGLLLLPTGFPGRWLGFLWMLPLVLLPVPRPEEGEVWFTLLEVGQGLSAVVRTRDHLLVYDTGPRYGPDFDAGGAVLVPFLRAAGIRRVDRLVLSHGDGDHTGGAESLLAALPVAAILGSKPPQPRVSLPPAEPCQAGQGWRWNGVDFAILYPFTRRLTGDNDASCVLRVSTPAGALLLAGDIERSAEGELTRRYADQLRSTILVVPHHGSISSSSQIFVDAVQPQYALYSVGYRNRFGFPHRDVMGRYTSHGTIQYTTAQEGALSFRLPAQGTLPLPQRHRRHAGRFWHRHPE
jgi:competence protein ComEC